MGRTPEKPQNPDGVQKVEALKAKWGLKTDKQLAERLKVDPTQIARWRAKGMTGIIATMADEILRNGDTSEGEKGQLWLAAA
jgi:hypothetical protein